MRKFGRDPWTSTYIVHGIIVLDGKAYSHETIKNNHMRPVRVQEVEREKVIDVQDDDGNHICDATRLQRGYGDHREFQ